MSETTSRMGEEADFINEPQERTYPEEVKTKSGTSNVVRFPDGSDAFRKYYISWFLCDDDTVKPFIIENETEGAGILRKLLGDSNNFFQGGYLESRKGPAGKIEIHRAKNPELFKRFTEYYNPAFGAPGTCRPSKEYVFNVIHRNPELINGQMVNWCQLNKHTKIMRFKQRAFKSLNVVRQNSGRFEEYDILFSKQGKGSDTFFTSMKADIGTQYNVVGPLTPEELAYERDDLDFITRLAQANYILNNLRNQIAQVDVIMGTNLIGELEKQLAVEEQAAMEYNQSADVGTPPIPTAPVNVPTSQDFRHQVSASATAPSPVPTVQPPSPVPQAPGRVPVSTAMITCGHCKEQIPEGLVVCPKCTGALVLNCDVCKQPFDAFASKCPHCGQEYTVNT